jgi:hypothetical protein
MTHEISLDRKKEPFRYGQQLLPTTGLVTATMRELALDAQPSSSESGDACLARVTAGRFAAKKTAK